ncbi:MAG: haloacid dehalogenase type II [Anaerolineae bacterium]|uniref:haloacid dehalogenase type II n=2 Tax=Thermoflexus sp. TaxID=1969742 RepID=UPI0025F3D06A|nr:haloacid dehalogenase type II [Thermoflexus sp.]MCS7351104.1 haloacid dehalogenase type II [Thermoflexus sp.]MDW8180557.1 haloacid dehalogenase type II [Anaerolineae bacterium]
MRCAMGRYRFLTFDCYGTLIDWQAGIAEHLGDILRQHGVDPAPEELLRIYVEEEHRLESGPYRRYREILAESARAAASRFGVRISNAEAQAFADSLPDWPPFPDTVDGLKAFGVMGFRRVILSNVDRDLLAETIRRHGLEVDGAITAEDTRTYKPNPRHWLAFCSRYTARREEVLHIAQSLLHDIRPALRLKLDCVWLNRYREPLPADVRPTQMFYDLDALVGWLLTS